MNDDGSSNSTDDMELDSLILGHRPQNIDPMDLVYDTDTSKEDDYSESDEEFDENHPAVGLWFAPDTTVVRSPVLQLLIISTDGEQVISPASNPNQLCTLLSLPAELRNLIYKYYFDETEEGQPVTDRSSFPDVNGEKLQLLHIGSEDVELKFWLTSPLLQSSRQLRFEAMPIFFKHRVITSDWISVLPRFVDFLGERGCAMVHYLDLWDTMDFQFHDRERYHDILASVSRFTCLRHLRIVLHLVKGSNTRARSVMGIEQGQKRPRGFRPRMDWSDLENYWPEVPLLKTISARCFTLAMSLRRVVDCVEFDTQLGAFPSVLEAMRSNFDANNPEQVSKSLNSTSLPSQQHTEMTKTTDYLERSVIQTDQSLHNSDLYIREWQETDALTDKSIPIYNFVRKLAQGEQYSEHHEFHLFPVAPESTGAIIRDCPFCYIHDRHCGFHALPVLDSHSKQGSIEAFENLSYVQIRSACRKVLDVMQDDMFGDWVKVQAILDHYGWPPQLNCECLDKLALAVKEGWYSEDLDEGEVMAWGVLYHEARSRYERPVMGSL